jgi:beta-glucanase (GH16 family)
LYEARKKLLWIAKTATPSGKYVQLNYGTDLHGSISGNGNQKLVAGSSGTEITAIPQAGYEFLSWSDGKTSATRTDTPVQDTTLVATFKQILYTITYLADAHGLVSGNTTQQIPAGSQSSSVTAKADDGYIFDGWSDGQSESTRSDTASNNKEVTAHFRFAITAPKISGHTLGSLLWSDEFTSASSMAIDNKSWTARNCGPATTNGGSTCMTGEVQYYAPSAVKLDGSGNLQITATHTSSLPADAGPCGSWSGGCPFVSGRLDTQGKVSFQYGYIEARIKMPVGGGNWPAFWMLGNKITSVGWPLSGEIDVVEAGGDKPTLVHGSLNYKGGGGTPKYVTAIKTSPTELSSGFHTYGVLWLENLISFYFDGELYETQTPATIDGPNWTFNAPFFVILNNAIAPAGSYFGGNWDGWQSSTMSVDYVRAWQVDGQGTVTQP